MNRISLLIHRIVFLAAFMLPILYLFSLIRGFYFSGDTVSFLQFATAAEKFRFWDVFLIHLSPWPPLAAIFYNLVQFLPGGFVTEQKAYLIFFFLLTLFACYLLVRKYSITFYDRIIFTALILFSSLQVLLLRVSIADVQFMAWWILAMFFLDQFIKTKREKYVALFLIPASFIPLTRYAGITVTLTLSLFLLIFSVINYKTKKYSINFVILASIFTLIPISFYLFRNFIASHTLFGYYDPQFAGISLFSILLKKIEVIVNDIALPFLVIVLLGTTITWRKDFSTRIILFILVILIYLSVVIIQQYRFRVTEFIPSRYTSPFYPLLLVTGLPIGAWLSRKFSIIKRFPKLGILFITLIFFSGVYYSTLRYFISELGFFSHRIPETEYSYDLQKFCNYFPAKTRYLFLQYDSRNWVAQSLNYFCKPTTWISMVSEKVTLPKDSVVISPYWINKPGFMKMKTFQGQKSINLYLVESTIELNIKEELTKLSSVLE